jgi:hypothetical protein
MQKQRYEIFQKSSFKDPTWVETATSLEEAKIRIDQLTQMFPAGYFILDCENQCFLIPCRCQDSRKIEC